MMKAELFVHKDSEYAVDSVRRLVASYIDPELSVEVSNIDAGRFQSLRIMGERYSRLLGASIPPELGLSLAMEGLDWLGGRMYIRIYSSVFSFGRTYDYSKTMEIFDNEFNVFFPALAIRDRMVIIPVGQREVLEEARPGDTSVGQVLKGDVIEVDFHDEQALRLAMQVMARGLLTQLRQELMAWQSFRPAGEFDIRMAARDLEVEAKLLQRILRDQAGEVRRGYEQLSCRLDKTGLPYGRWTRMVLTVINQSDRTMTAVKVSVAGPVEVLPSRIEVDLPASTEISVALSMKPADEGEFPIEITLIQLEDAPFTTWIPPFQIWLNSARTSESIGGQLHGSADE
jgi:hypothetical protein